MGVLESGAEHPAGQIDHSCPGTNRCGDRGFVAHGAYPLPGDGEGTGE